MHRHGYESSPYCKFCLQFPETIEHLLLNCTINHLARHYLNNIIRLCLSVCLCVPYGRPNHLADCLNPSMGIEDHLAGKIGLVP